MTMHSDHIVYNLKGNKSILPLVCKANSLNNHQLPILNASFYGHYLLSYYLKLCFISKSSGSLPGFSEFFYSLFSEFDKSTPVSGSSSIPRGVILFGSGVNVESGLSSALLLVIL